MTRVLVTGASGFVGRRLCKRLAEDFWDVLMHDASDSDLSVEEPPFENVDWVIHLAAMTFVPESWEKPALYYRVNVMGTENVLELCRRNGCGITFMSTYVYGVPQYLPIDEEHPVLPNSPYNHSKFLAEELCRFYNRVFNIPVVIFRPFNIFGPGQASHFLVPAILDQLLDDLKKEITLMDVEPIRDYVYVDDVIEALVRSIGRKNFQIYNLGSGTAVSVLELAKTAMEVSGKTKPVKSEYTRRKNEVSNISCSIKKAHLKLGWTPQVNLKEGLSKMLVELMQ